MGTHRRRVDHVGKLAVRRIRTQDGCEHREQREQRREQEAGAHRHGDSAHTLPVVRGSTTASAMSEARIPAPSAMEPTAAQPATRYASRATSASYMRAPRPGHATTYSTTNEPLISAPTMMP